jgi:ornithine cyclodeaminase/alanine dehydrogenase-like protein (mu-crystallin family)
VVLLLDNDAIDKVLDPAAIVEALEQAYRQFAGGSGVSAPRQDLQAASSGANTYQLGLVAGIAGPYACLRIKSDMTYLREVAGQPRKEKFCVAPGSYLGLLLLFSVENGAPLAILHDGLIQRMRVGADSAIGARLMARSGASVLGILGSGGMAMSHLRTVGETLGLREVRVYSPTAANRDAFAAAARELGYAAQAAEAPEDVFEAADILCACTSAVGPVVPGSLVRPGMHITAIGGSLDAAASGRVDRWLRLGTATPAPEWGGQPLEDECLSFAAGGEKSRSGGTRRFADIPSARRVMLGDLLADPALGRTTPRQVTFSDRGNVHGVQFAAVAGQVFEQARAAGLGRELPLADFIQSIRN